MLAKVYNGHNGYVLLLLEMDCIDASEVFCLCIVSLALCAQAHY